MSAKKDTKGNNDTVVIIGFLVIVAVLLGFIFSVKYFMKKEESKPIVNNEINDYHGYRFVKKEGFWFTDVRVNNQTSFELSFYYHPEDTLNITTRKNIPIMIYNISRVYITLDPDLPSTTVIAGTEISKIIGKVIGKNVKAGLTRDAGNGVPVVTCENITKDQRVILLDITNRTEISVDNGCIIVEGKTPAELIRASDRLAYEFLYITEAGVIGRSAPLAIK